MNYLFNKRQEHFDNRRKLKKLWGNVNEKRIFRMIGIIILLQMLVMAVVFVFVDVSITANIKNNSIKSMETIAQERSKIIENYITETENYLTAYSRASDITELLLHPEDAKVVANAQNFTEIFSR